MFHEFRDSSTIFCDFEGARFSLDFAVSCAESSSKKDPGSSACYGGGNPPGPYTLPGRMDGFTFPNESTCKKPSEAASITPPSKFENMSGMDKSAKGLNASPKSDPGSAIPPQGPDSSTTSTPYGRDTNYTGPPLDASKIISARSST